MFILYATVYKTLDIFGCPAYHTVNTYFCRIYEYLSAEPYLLAVRVTFGVTILFTTDVLSLRTF